MATRNYWEQLEYSYGYLYCPEGGGGTPVKETSGNLADCKTRRRIVEVLVLRRQRKIATVRKKWLRKKENEEGDKG
jgi:hypothetical protein